jgi:pimeloyl-ACP methyl ester carboxylesterase
MLRQIFNNRTSPLLFLLLGLLTVLPAFAAGPAVDTKALRADGAGFEDVVDPARAFFDKGLGDAAFEKDGALFEQVYQLTHLVPVGDGKSLFVTEHFTLGSWLTWPHRSALFLSGSAFRGNHHNIPVEGYDATSMMARRGFFAFTVDYLGVGESTRPANGLEASFEANQEALEVLLRYIRFFRAVPRIDLIGAGYGGSLATQLAADDTRVRSVVMSAMLYDQLVGGPLTDPAFVALLESSPDGYFFIPGEGSGVFLTEAPQAVRDYVFATQGGFYPTLNFLVAAGDLPFFDPGVARVPGLILFGENDIVVGPGGVDNLALDYGTEGALLISRPDAGHAPRTGSPEIAAWFWENVFDFLDPPY